MKGACIFLACVLLLAQTFALSLPRHQKTTHVRKTIMHHVPAQAQKVGLDLCKTCIEFSEQAINELLNLILQGGVVGTCGKLCQALADKTKSPAIGAVCNILCDIVGIDEFIKAIKKADLDPIYMCELVTACSVYDTGDAKITKFDVTPKSGPQGHFVIDFLYTSMNGTGTGEIDLDIVTVDGIPVGQGFLHEQAAAGNFSSSIKLDAEPDPNCDPTQQPCEMWTPGTYTVKIAICNGECGSKHPHSQIYDEASTTFTITQ